MTVCQIKAEATRRMPAFAKHPGDAQVVIEGATTRCIVCGAALLIGAMPVISLLGAVWFLVVQPALH